MEPFIVKDFFDPILLKVLQEQVRLLKDASIPVDTETFYRKQFHNHPLFKIIHQELTAKASYLFKEELKPSYNFISMYFEGEGKCPIHVDRPQCYRTIDVCLRKNGDWPIQITHDLAWDEDNLKEIKEASFPYLLDEGDAVLYSGTEHPHFRHDAKDYSDKLFNDLVFFHFVPKNFEGSLD